MKNNFNDALLHVDSLALVIIGLVVFIAVCVGSFASRYLQGDTRYRAFFVQLVLLVISVAAMVSADHMAILFATWCISNVLLVRLMIHKASWKAAKASGLLATKTYLLGAMCVAAAFIILYKLTGETSIQALYQHAESNFTLIALMLLLIGAMTQSAIWPFHRWLISSLNSPTPVSAIMHAGLVNGGGFLLARFAPLYLNHSYLLTMIFVIGIVTALLGTLWKLMQSDVKRMLACSTMGQMGFMLAQCGLGLFPAAIAHLIWHGMFKAYLFLASGSVAQEKRLDLHYPPSLLTFACALICGLVASLSFGLSSGKTWLEGDTTLVLMVVAFLAATQFAIPLLRRKTLSNFPGVLTATVLTATFYGASVHLVTWWMEPLQLMKPQALNGFHIAGIVALISVWLCMLFMRNHKKARLLPTWILKGYVTALNASQPHPDTVTAHRNHYQYL